MPFPAPTRDAHPGGEAASSWLSEGFGVFGGLQVDGFGERVSLALEARTRSLLDRLHHHHPDSAVHSFRVAEITMGMWRLAPDILGSAETALLGSLLHDVGKIFVPRSILSSRRLLTERERAIVSSHSTLGAELLQEMGFPEPIVAIAAGHHERWAGDGYPTGRPACDQLPIVRAVAVADAFDAMTDVRRAYRAPLNWSEALQETAACAGTHFEPLAAQILAESLERDGRGQFHRDQIHAWPDLPGHALRAPHLDLQLLNLP